MSYLSIKLASFPDTYEVAKIKALYKKGLKTDQRTSGPFCCCHLSQRL